MGCRVPKEDRFGAEKVLRLRFRNGLQVEVDLSLDCVAWSPGLRGMMLGVWAQGDSNAGFGVVLVGVEELHGGL